MSRDPASPDAREGTSPSGAAGRPIAAVGLDAAGTLFTERTSRPAMYRRVLARHGVDVPLDRLARWMGEVHDALPREVEGHFQYSDGWFDAFVAGLLARAGAELPAGRLRAELSEDFTDPAAYVVFPDVRPALAALRERGLLLAVVSNWSGRLAALLERLELAAAFDALAISAEVRAAKPDPRIFHRAAEGLGVPAERCLHIGDHPAKDVEGARAAGWSALLLRRPAVPAPAGAGGPPPPSRRPALPSPPPATVADLLEALDHLNRARP